MAKAPAKPESSDDATPKKKSKLMMIIVILLLVVLIIVAGAVGAIVLLKGKSSDAAAPAAAAEPAATMQAPGVVDLSKPPTFVPLDAFTVNLRREEGDHYLQVVVVLRVADAKMGDSLKAFMPEIRHRINLLLSSKLPSELSSAEGREELAASIGDQANEALGFPPVTDSRGRTFSNGPVQAVLFNSFIIQ